MERNGVSFHNLYNFKIAFHFPICYDFGVLSPFPISGLGEVLHESFTKKLFGNIGVFHGLCGFVQITLQNAIT